MWPGPINAPLPFNASDDTSLGSSEIDEICGNQPGDIPCANPLVACSTYTQVLGPDHVYTFTAFVGNSLTFLVHPTDDDYDTSVYLTTICGDGASCETGIDACYARTNGGNPCGAVSDETFGFVVLPAGVYYLYVDSWYAPGNPDGYDSGSYDLTVNGTLPVELIEFSVE